MGQRFGTVRGVDPVTRGRIGGSSAAGNLRLLDERDWEWRRRGPTPQAVREFGVREDALRRLPGGAGHVWTDGRLVLKPVGCVPEHAWVCEVFATWVSDEVRVPEPIAPKDGADPRWSIEGWGAHVFAPGRDADLVRELPLVKHASDAFHHAVEHLPRPAFLDTRDDPWAFGDRLAWEDAEPEGDAPTLEVIRRLQDSLRPVGSRSQVIHGDILPNVLVKTGARRPSSTGRRTSGRSHRQRGGHHRCGDLPRRASRPARRMGNGRGMEPAADPCLVVPTRPNGRLRCQESVDGQPRPARGTGTPCC